MAAPTLHEGVGISDREIVVRFTKPINNEYDYLLAWEFDQKKYNASRSANYGPIWSDIIVVSKENTPVQATVALMCYYNSSVRSAGVDVSGKTLRPCKLIDSFHFQQTSFNSSSTGSFWLPNAR